MMLSTKNVDFQRRETWEEYSKATSVFNGFFGIIAMVAYNAANEANDAYEGTPEYRHQTKKAFKTSQEAWARLWRTARRLFEDKYAVYADFITMAAEDMSTDLQKLYLAVHASLLKQDIKDTDRKAWVYAADMLAHELTAIYQRFVRQITEETRREIIGKSFRWADPTHITNCAHDCVRAVATRDVMMDDNVMLALEIIARKALSSEYQDESAIKALSLKGNEEFKEQMAESIEEFQKHKDERIRQEQEANDNYWSERQKQRQRHRKGRQETLTTDTIAARLGERFNVTRT